MKIKISATFLLKDEEKMDLLQKAMQKQTEIMTEVGLHLCNQDIKISIQISSHYHIDSACCAQNDAW